MGHATASGRTREEAASFTPVSDGTIHNDRIYRVHKISSSGRDDSDYGNMTGADVKLIIRGTTYDPVIGMWFTRRATIGYTVEEVR